MGNVNIYKICFGCNGVATKETPEGSIPCGDCGGTGKTLDNLMDDTIIQQIITTQTAHTAELDYIHGKVTAIWNQVKPGN